ncbi:MAG: hypothetical protein M0C28_12000 [Candidatus Moduliflexus flocculans]|nr:hypothetical protein [Candidatus Moduliflexus flocculans]
MRERGGPDASGFMLLDRSEEGLRWRLALIDHARYTLDTAILPLVGTPVGVLMMQLVVHGGRPGGARCGLIVDDLLTLRPRRAGRGQPGRLPEHRGPPVQPWHYRPLFGRGVEMAEKMERPQPPHAQQATRRRQPGGHLGGRNIGDEYFGMNEPFNFHDLDCARASGRWRARPRRSSTASGTARWWRPPPAPCGRLSIYDLDPHIELGGTPAAVPPMLTLVGTEPQAGTGKSTSLPAHRQHRNQPRHDAICRTGTPSRTTCPGGARAHVHGDPGGAAGQRLHHPGREDPRRLRGLTARGVRVRILTGSLASQDVPAVNSRHKHWRKPLIEAGVGLHEIRARRRDPADGRRHARRYEGGIHGAAHTKALAVDRRRVFIGSMQTSTPAPWNSTARWAPLIKEERRFRGKAGKQLIERNLQPENSWKVVAEPIREELRWVAGECRSSPTSRR